MLRKKNNDYMPDVLDCLANLSNDEVFTPPSVASKMLDMLPQEVFKSTKTTFLDPFSKTGVFLREITKRLLEHQLPDYKRITSEIEQITKEAIQEAVKNCDLDLNDKDYEQKAKKMGNDALAAHKNAAEYHQFEMDLQAALDHILTKQVFGIAITELTANLTRRSLYCSKDAAGRYSVSGHAFGRNGDGNIRFVPMSHIWNKEPVWDEKEKKWKGANCKYCGASSEMFERPGELEQHAYEFIHKDIEEVKKEFPKDMFENLTVIGNPPYQLNDGGGTGDSAIPIYHKFIEQAKRLNPRYLTMIVPSRWMKGGRGLDSFRTTMMNDTCICKIVDYEDASSCFSNVHIDGGICYFLRDSLYNGPCEFQHIDNKQYVDESIRYLKCALSNNVIRDSRQIGIIEKVRAIGEASFSTIVSSLRPYGFRTFLFNTPEQYPDADLRDAPLSGYCKVFGVKGKKGGAKRVTGYVKRSSVNDVNSTLDAYKLFFSYSYTTSATVPPEIIVGQPNELCTETFVSIGNFTRESDARNCLSYIKTKFFRALLMFNRIGMHVSSETMAFVPMQDFSKPWTDTELYAKYRLTQEEIDYIESNIEPME